MCTKTDINKSFQRLEKSLTDVIAEEQAKLGYMKEAMRLYYPLSSLKHFFESNDASADDMLKLLSAFPDFCSARLGGMKISHDGETFCFYLAPEASEYVHLNKAENEFIFRLAELLQGHDTKLDTVISFFKEYGTCDIKEINNGEFDILIRFTDGDDPYYYCFKDEGCHVIYHRFLPEDYMDFEF